MEFSSKASDLKGKDRGSPNWWPSVLEIGVVYNSSNIIDELWGIRIKSEFSIKASELDRGFEVRRIGDPLFL